MGDDHVDPLAPLLLQLLATLLETFSRSIALAAPWRSRIRGVVFDFDLNLLVTPLLNDGDLLAFDVDLGDHAEQLIGSDRPGDQTQGHHAESIDSRNVRRLFMELSTFGKNLGTQDSETTGSRSFLDQFDRDNALYALRAVNPLALGKCTELWVRHIKSAG